MNSYVFDTAAITTFRVDAESEDDARRIVMLCDGIEYDTDHTKVRLQPRPRPRRR
jgi:hypothetical protein